MYVCMYIILGYIGGQCFEGWVGLKRGGFRL